MIGALKRRRQQSEAAAQLCAVVSRQAREAIFYRDYGVADSVDGRFDLLALHAWLVLERLQDKGESALAQGFVDALFVRFDEALREQGAGDIGIGRRIKKMAGAFYGRLRAYSESRDGTALAGAILRNVYRGDPCRLEQASALAKYVCDARRQMTEGRFSVGGIQFGPIPSP
jgi:cytochrome b pre-mRNA-processing protein 3